jgi:hypothetical protein
MPLEGYESMGLGYEADVDGGVFKAQGSSFLPSEQDLASVTREVSDVETMNDMKDDSKSLTKPVPESFYYFASTKFVNCFRTQSEFHGIYSYTTLYDKIMLIMGIR